MKRLCTRQKEWRFLILDIGRGSTKMNEASRESDIDPSLVRLRPLLYTLRWIT